MVRLVRRGVRDEDFLVVNCLEVCFSVDQHLAEEVLGRGQILVQIVKVISFLPISVF